MIIASQEKRLPEQRCVNAGCQQTFRPPDKRRRTRCPACAGDRWQFRRVDQSRPAKVATNRSVGSAGSANDELVRVALRQARKAAAVSLTTLPERDQYVAALNTYARSAAAGHVPDEAWQPRTLGHLIARRPEMRPRGTASTGHARNGVET